MIAICVITVANVINTVNVTLKTLQTLVTRQTGQHDQLVKFDIYNECYLHSICHKHEKNDIFYIN